jgi:AcrR family transcriptional regulator
MVLSPETAPSSRPKRRASYGPNSPLLGVKGARTRQRLLAAALARFAAQGFHATVVDDIARDAGVSRATFYQYFDSREQLVEELLEECGSALMRLVRRMGAIGATSQGFDNLHWWLGEWAYVYDKYATIFVEWAHIDSPQTPLRPMVTAFVERYTAALAERLSRSGVHHVDHEAVALALVTVIERFNYYRHTQAVGVSDAQMLDTLATCAQLLLFPGTDPQVFRAADDAEFAPARMPPRDRRPPVVRSAPTRAASRFDGPASATSVEQLLRAGASVLGERGYTRSSVDQILLSAGLSRRTFYKYFDSRLDLVLVLSRRCAARVETLATGLRGACASADNEGELRAWIDDAVSFAIEDGGILRTWLEEPPHEALELTGRAAVQSVLQAYRDVAGNRSLPASFHPVAGGWLLLAAVERLPHQAVTTRYDLSGPRLLEVMQALLGRGLRLTPPAG